MHVFEGAPTPLDYFATLVQSDGDFVLFEAAVAVAQDAYPDLDIQAVLDELDALQLRLLHRIGDDPNPVRKLQLLNHLCYRELHLACHPTDFYNPDNSFVHRVLQTRRGIPITLALLWLELAQGIGLSAQGVGFPGHFLLKIWLPQGLAVIDPANGSSLCREDLCERLDPYLLRSARLDDLDSALQRHLQAATPREILTRQLRNLKEIYRVQKAWLPLLAVQERLVVVQPECWSEYRDRGLTHAELGHVGNALADLECYLVHSDERADLDAIADRVEALRRRSLP